MVIILSDLKLIITESNYICRYLHSKSDIKDNINAESGVAAIVLPDTFGHCEICQLALLIVSFIPNLYDAINDQKAP